LAKAMGLLAHLDERIAALARPANPPVSDLERKLTPENLSFFRQDEDVFAAEAPERPALFAVRTEQSESAFPPLRQEQPDAEPKRRVVIIRRPPSGQVAIPLAAEEQASAAG
jgi:hypothetical protein